MLIRTPALNALIELVTNPPHDSNDLVVQADKKQILLKAAYELIEIVSRLDVSEESDKKNSAANLVLVTGINLTVRNLREENEDLKRKVVVLEKALKEKTEPPGKS